MCLYFYKRLCVACSLLVRFPFVADELKHFPGTIAMDRFAGQLWWCSMDTQVKIGGDEEELEEDIFEKEEEGDGDEDDEVGFDDDDNSDDGDDEVHWSSGCALWILGWKLDVMKMRRMFLMVMKT